MVSGGWHWIKVVANPAPNRSRRNRTKRVSCRHPRFIHDFFSVHSHPRSRHGAVFSWRGRLPVVRPEAVRARQHRRQGVVVALNATRGHQPSYAPTVQYLRADGRVAVYHHDVFSRPSQYFVGQEVTVYYDPVGPGAAGRRVLRGVRFERVGRGVYAGGELAEGGAAGAGVMGWFSNPKPVSLNPTHPSS